MKSTNGCGKSARPDLCGGFGETWISTVLAPSPQSSYTMTSRFAPTPKVGSGSPQSSNRYGATNSDETNGDLETHLSSRPFPCRSFAKPKQSEKSSLHGRRGAQNWALQLYLLAGARYGARYK